MKLGEFETFVDGRVHCKSGAEVDRAVYEGFIRALHAAHERGEVVVAPPGGGRWVPHGEACCEAYSEALAKAAARPKLSDIIYPPPSPLTAEAIGAAVAKALTSHAIATYSDQMLNQFADRAADAIGIAMAKALHGEIQDWVPLKSSVYVSRAELAALREVAEASRRYAVCPETDMTLRSALAHLDAAHGANP